jgi:NTP pyrophosphatase (non-canonical NTP hydrolase)
MKEYPDTIRWDGMPEICAMVKEEHSRQFKKWGVQKRTLFEWLAYLTEEVGELAEAISENEYRDGSTEEIKKEAVQVAALAFKIINNI